LAKSNGNWKPCPKSRKQLPSSKPTIKEPNGFLPSPSRVKGGNHPDMPAIAKHLQKKLPKYMTPAAVTWLEKFPLTPSGKLDRKALALPQWRGPERSYRVPSTRTKLRWHGYGRMSWAFPKLERTTIFSSLGGTSLQAVMIFAKISRAHGFDLPAATMVRAPTIALQAALLEEIWRTNDRSVLVTFRESGDGPPLFFVHGGGGGVMYLRDLMQDLKCSNPLYGLHAPPLDGKERLPRIIEKFAARYVDEIRKVQPAGPYHILGFSAGGTIAYEMARQLQEAGEVVTLLGLIETGTGRYRTAIREARAALYSPNYAPAHHPFPGRKTDLRRHPKVPEETAVKRHLANVRHAYRSRNSL
jgi:pimeloyl-ACP methyl ester carboxylesterase